jgi:hypothetical protein
MDPVFVGVLATLAGTIVGAGTQMLQSWRQRRWQERLAVQEANSKRGERHRVELKGS